MKKIIFLAFLFVSSNSFAAIITGPITGFLPISSGDTEVLLVKIGGGTTAGCNTSARFAIDSNSKRYDATFASVLAAFHAGDSIKVNYLSSCNAWHNSADINYICVGIINC